MRWHNSHVQCREMGFRGCYIAGEVTTAEVKHAQVWQLLASLEYMGPHPLAACTHW